MLKNLLLALGLALAILVTSFSQLKWFISATLNRFLTLPSGHTVCRVSIWPSRFGFFIFYFRSEKWSSPHETKRRFFSRNREFKSSNLKYSTIERLSHWRFDWNQFCTFFLSLNPELFRRRRRRRRKARSWIWNSWHETKRIFLSGNGKWYRDNAINTIGQMFQQRYLAHEDHIE